MLQRRMPGRLMGSVPLMSGSLLYWKYLRNLFGSNDIFLLPLWEASGTTAEDISGNGNDCGIVVNPTWGQDGIDENTALYLGPASVLKNFPAAVNNAFNGDEGFFSVWTKITTAVWEDGTIDILLQITAGADAIWIRKHSTAHRLQCAHIADGSGISLTMDGISLTDLFNFTITWGPNELIAYINGEVVGGPSAALGTWVGGVPTVLVVGGGSIAPSSPFQGVMQYAALGTKQLTPSEVSAIANPFL